VKIDPKLGGQWKEKEKFPMLGGQWKEKEKFLFTFFHFPPNNLLEPSSFSFDITVLLYHSFRPLFTHSLFLSLAYKL